MNRSGWLLGTECLDRSGTAGLLDRIAWWLEIALDGEGIEIDRLSVATSRTTRPYATDDRRAGRERKQPLATR